MLFLAVCMSEKLNSCPFKGQDTIYNHASAFAIPLALGEKGILPNLLGVALALWAMWEALRPLWTPP